jgi:uncharacterized surface protein with fasciclin (FAS1) repeats
MTRRFAMDSMAAWGAAACAFGLLFVAGCQGQPENGTGSAASNAEGPAGSGVKPAPESVPHTPGVGMPQAPAETLPANTGDVVQVIQADPRFKTLNRAILAAGLRPTLKGAGPYTVFAPTDQAFARLPAGQLESLLRPENKAQLATLLRAHVVPRRITGQDVRAMDNGVEIAALGGSVRIEKKDQRYNGAFEVNDADVLQADIPATNGVVHAIDGVLVPASLGGSDVTSGTSGSRGASGTNAKPGGVAPGDGLGEYGPGTIH